MPKNRGLAACRADLPGRPLLVVLSLFPLLIDPKGCMDGVLVIGLVLGL